MRLCNADRYFAGYIAGAFAVLLCLALCSCAHVKWGNPGSSGYEGEIKPVFPSLTPAPCKEEGP